MGLLDGILGSVMGNMAGGQQGGGTNPLLQIAMQMLMQQGGGTGGGAGGLASIVDQFKQGGLGHLADSWVGSGQNLPVSADQLTQALGSGKIAEIASQLGMTDGDVAGGLSHILPELINHVTPNGQMPESHSLVEEALSAFLKK